MGFAGELEYDDSEMYANGSTGAGGNDGYGNDCNSSSGSGRYQIPHQISQGAANIGRSPQHSARNAVRESSQKYPTANYQMQLNNQQVSLHKYFAFHGIVYIGILYKPKKVV